MGTVTQLSGAKCQGMLAQPSAAWGSDTTLTLTNVEMVVDGLPSVVCQQLNFHISDVAYVDGDGVFSGAESDNCWGCGASHRPGFAAFQVCGRCRTEYEAGLLSTKSLFCSKECLVVNWPRHKVWHEEKKSVWSGRAATAT